MPGGRGGIAQAICRAVREFLIPAMVSLLLLAVLPNAVSSSTISKESWPAGRPPSARLTCRRSPRCCGRIDGRASIAGSTQPKLASRPAMAHSGPRFFAAANGRAESLHGGRVGRTDRSLKRGDPRCHSRGKSACGSRPRSSAVDCRVSSCTGRRGYLRPSIQQELHHGPGSSVIMKPGAGGCGGSREE
jgi:hypothetical protein